MNRDELIEALVGLGFLRDAMNELPTKSLGIVWACHK
jgi:hypothetical protein